MFFQFQSEAGLTDALRIGPNKPQKSRTFVTYALSALRYYKLGSIGYALNGFGIFIIFSIQDWSNWDLASANAMIYQIAAFAWAVFGALMLIYSLGDLKESKAEAAY